jgi:transcription termination factor Rho
MDELDLTPSDAPATKLRKTPAKRGRVKASDAGSIDSASSTPSTETASDPSSSDSVPITGEAGQGAASPDQVGAQPSRPRRPRTRRPKAGPGTDDAAPQETTEFFSPAASDTELPPHQDTDTGSRLYSFSPDEAPEQAFADGIKDERPEERPHFVPDALRDQATTPPASSSTDAQAAPADERAAPPNTPPEQPGTGAGRRDDRKSWWERKKEKKRQKWLERQGGGAPGAGPHGGPAAFAPRPERAPAQPPPPALQPALGALPADERLADAAALEAVAEELARDPQPLDLGAIHAASAGELAQQLRALGETVVGMPPRRGLVEQLFAWAARGNRALRETGVLDLTDAGHGFLVHRVNSYRVYPESTYVPAALVKRHGLRRGQEIELLARAPRQGERCPAAVRAITVMGTTPEAAREVTAFEELVPYYPTARILVEAADIHKDISMRAVDLLTPIGFGQRGLIVAPPRTGKTVLLQNIANSVSANYPDATLILLLIDERPEEVTDFRRHTKGEVVSSTFDETPESHVHAAEMVIERARRLVETGKHVVILLDSITRLARAYNALAGSGGKTMSGGIESNALQRPKRFFGSARNIEGGGSITILATALIDTNSRMDEVIFEEFKGTGNMELHLDRGLSDKRIFPAINIDRSGTRKEELIYHPDEMLRVYGLRRAMQGIPPVEAMDMFIQRLKKTRTNTEFLLSLNR